MGSSIRLDGKVALVTGAGRGLGRAHAMELAARGARVMVNDVGCGLYGEGADASIAESVVREIHAAGGAAAASALSVADPDSARRIVRDTVDAFGRLDIVVNNAGVLRRLPFLQHTPEMLTALLDVHLVGAFLISQAAFELMLAQEYGRFVFTASPGGTRGNQFVAAYGAAKGGVIGLAQVIALAGGPHNIKANVISPYASTRMAGAVQTKSDEEWLYEQPDVISRVLDPRQVSGAVAYLASEECDLNHTILTVGGGRVALSAMVIGEGWQVPSGEMLTAEAVRDHLCEIVDLSAATNPLSSDQEASAFLGPVVQAAIAERKSSARAAE
jgi:NAD(P)-dependent dehydrogenase (short-subunit alcohol dehydrogenase family)